MIAIRHILAIIVTVCITVSTILGGFQKEEAQYPSNTLESKVLKFEGLGEAILNFTEHTLTLSAFFPCYFYDATEYKFAPYKSFVVSKAHLLVNLFSRNAFYVFVSINAP